MRLGGVLFVAVFRQVTGFSLSYTNTNYDNSNTNVSSHLCDKEFTSTDLANTAKNKSIK